MKRGLSGEAIYDLTLYIMAGFLVLGFVANILVKPVAARYFMTGEELDRERRLGSGRDVATAGKVAAQEKAQEAWHPSPTSWIAVTVAWTFAGIPLAWGVLQAVKEAAVLFK
jgi:hypothetical protein